MGTRDLNCGRGRVFGRVAFVAVADITDAIAVTAGIAVVNFFQIRTTYCKT